jgi:nitrogen fixation NifU-like protein
MSRMYTDRLLEHFRNPHHVGELPAPALTVDVSNPACGDLLRLSAHVHQGLVKEVRYKVKGCTASIAAGSALTDWMIGKSVADLAGFEAAVIDEELGGLGAESRHAAVLCLDGVRALLRSLQS